MQVVNSSFRITDRQGVQKEDPTAFAGFVDMFGFPELADAVWFDPHVIYDSLHGRWLLTMDGFDCNLRRRMIQHLRPWLPVLRDIRHDRPDGLWTGSYLLGTDLLIDYTAPGTSTDKIRVREQPLRA